MESHTCQTCDRKNESYVTYFKYNENIICEYCYYQVDIDRLPLEINQCQDARRKANLIKYYHQMIGQIPPGPIRDFHERALINVETEQKTRYQCVACDYYTDKTSAYKNHLASKKHQHNAHHVNVVSIKSVPQFVCEKCGKNFKRGDNLKRHRSLNVCFENELVVPEQFVQRNQFTVPQEHFAQRNQFALSTALKTRSVGTCDETVLDFFADYEPEITTESFNDLFERLDNFKKTLTSKRYDGLSKTEKSRLDQHLYCVFYRATPEGFAFLREYVIDLVKRDEKSPVRDALLLMFERLISEIQNSDDIHWRQVYNALTD